MNVAPRKDRVERKGGIIHLNAEFRQVAQLANRAGLEGYEVADVDVGMDLVSALARVTDDDLDLKARIEITYRETPKARLHASGICVRPGPARDLLRSAKAASHLCKSLLALRDGATDELISEICEALDAAIAKAEGTA